MRRAVPCALLLAALAGCRLPSEPAPLRPLPDDAPPLAFADVVDRARSQVALATEAFYIDGWADVEYAARGLEQSARFLQKATEVPPSVRTKLPDHAGALARQAVRLREAAQAHDVRRVNDGLQQIQLTIRALRVSP
jgi:hypothetical protein